MVRFQIKRILKEEETEEGIKEEIDETFDGTKKDPEAKDYSEISEALVRRG